MRLAKALSLRHVRLAKAVPSRGHFPPVAETAVPCKAPLRVPRVPCAESPRMTWETGEKVGLIDQVAGPVISYCCGIGNYSTARHPRGDSFSPMPSGKTPPPRV